MLVVTLFERKLAILMIYLAFTPFSLASETIFSENFNDLPDWTSDEIYKSKNQLDNLSVPGDWYAGTSRPIWSPATSHEDRHAVGEILAKNAEMARGGTGKSHVNWRESYNPGWSQFNSDSVLLKYFPNGYDELYVEFWITFSNEMVRTYYEEQLGQSKIFRIYHFNGDESAIFDYFGDENKPSFNWDVSGGASTGYGLRNFQAYLARGDNDIADYIKGLPSKILKTGDVSLSYTTASLNGQAVNGGTSLLSNFKDGGVIGGGPVSLDQVFGTEEQWVKVAFYVKMNSAPGAADGELMQWIDNKRILHATSIPWVREGFDMVKWNTIGIGGNDYFQAYHNDLRYEEWYAIDDVLVLDGIPEELLGHKSNAPNPPEGVLLH
ncbi:hypothetical protein [Marinobacter sp. 1_MG-2023]|uniref:hypothetical protein n=1 Tax=Marinobacter sp. 1_MG-2023 TaxID=3062627 RepID=UPI0026E138B6|nr:hypothetical protein [Marinobacter sp. 1_MG-2023]MDO6824574.1 hypothetical protein [Marinobacter sp. 1_MG-2023]